MSREITVKQIFDEILPGKFDAEAARGEQATIQVNISGDGGGEWYLVVDDGACTVFEGIHDNPDATIKMGAEDYIAMNTGKLNAIMAVTFGKLKFSGNQNVLFKMQKWFPF
jgi:putative sterol carrier protein